MNTKQLRQKFLSLAIEGKLVPQDANDEPAIELLKRIDPKIQHISEDMPFEVPESWVWCKVENIARSIKYGVSESAKDKGRYKLLRITDIQNNVVNWDCVPYTDYEESKAKSYLLQEGDILFARTGATVGKSYIVRGIEQEAIYASYLIRIQTAQNVCQQYVKFYFESDLYWNQIEQKQIGTGQPNVNGTILASLPIPLPPLAEQQRIVERLEHIFSLIDTIEQTQDKMRETIKSTRQKLLSLAIEGKLVPQDAHEEPAIELLKRINPKFVQPEYEEELPQGWCWCSLRDVVSITMGQSPKGVNVNKLDGVEFHQGKINFGNIYLERSGIYTREVLKIAEENSLLLCVRAPVGDVNITQRRICIGRGLCTIKPKEGNLHFFFYLLQTLKASLESKATGSTFKAISKDIILSELIPLPPLAEQKRIVEKLEQLFSTLYTIESNLN